METAKNKNNDLNVIRVDDQSFLINKNDKQFTIIVKQKQTSINFFIKRPLSASSYEGIFTYEDFIKLHKIFNIFEELEEIYGLIINSIQQNQIDLHVDDDFLNLTLKIDVNIKKHEISLKIPKNPEVNLSQVVDEMSGIIINLTEKIKNLNPPQLFTNSTILKENEFNIVKNWIGKDVELKLLYKSSVHGDRAADFHSKCDNKGPTISFIETMRGVRFGGYTSLSWDQTGSYKTNDTEAFLFSLDNQRKYAITNQSNVIYCNSAYNVTFGGGHDFYIADYIGHTGSYSNFPHSFGKNDNFENRGQTYLTGGYYFIVKEIEVFSVVFK
jgi:hypothetical protein